MFGRQSSNHGFYSFESFTIPPAIYHYDVATGKTDIFAKPQGSRLTLTNMRSRRSSITRKTERVYRCSSRRRRD